MKAEEKISLLRKALTDLCANAPSGDELRLLAVGVNGPSMSKPDDNGKAIHEQCDRLTAARAQAVLVLKQTDGPVSRMAFVAVVVDDGYRLGIAQENEPGYQPCQPTEIPFGPYLKDKRMDETGRVKSYEDAKVIADELNERLFGISKVDGFMIAASSMRNGVR